MIEEITIKGQKYSLEEARELYRELHDLFGPKEFTPHPYYIPIKIDPYLPADRWYITSSANTLFPHNETQ